MLKIKVRVWGWCDVCQYLGIEGECGPMGERLRLRGHRLGQNVGPAPEANQHVPTQGEGSI